MKKPEELNGLSKPHTTLKTNLQCSMIIALCFLWTATGYLSWMYHLPFNELCRSSLCRLAHRGHWLFVSSRWSISVRRYCKEKKGRLHKKIGFHHLHRRRFRLHHPFHFNQPFAVHPHFRLPDESVSRNHCRLLPHLTGNPGGAEISRSCIWRCIRCIQHIQQMEQIF